MNKVILFGNLEWCASCRKLHPIFTEVSKEMKDKFEFVDLDVESDEGVDLSTEYQVRNIPTIIVLSGDEVKERITGTKTKEQLTEILEKYI